MSHHAQTVFKRSLVLDAHSNGLVCPSQRQLVQLVVDGLDLLIKIEKKLRAGESADDLIPAGAK